MRLHWQLIPLNQFIYKVDVTIFYYYMSITNKKG